MKRHFVHSSAIRSIGYDPNKHHLEVRYIDGDLYRYFGVPQLVAAKLEKASSKGQFINEIVKPFFKMKRIQET